jgi:tRNA (guanine-N7-)-methyltransferase
MGQKKLIKFAAIKEYENVLEYPQDMQGKWNDFFENLSGEQAKKPLVVELACGRGEYAVGLGRIFPAQNFIGIDIKGNRIWKGASIANKEGLKNIAFVRTQIDQVTNYFAKEEVSEIWITFPDPQLRWSKAKKRLTHPKFLRLYQQFLKQSDASNKTGIVHLKTDSPNLFLFTLKVIELYGLNLVYKTDDLYAQPIIDPRCLIKTYYEGKDIAQSNKIHYIQFTLDKDLPLELDEVLKEAIRDIPLDAGELLRMQNYEQE